MRSAMWIGGHDFEIQESQPLEPGPGEVRISVHACGVCGTDLHAIQGLLGVIKPPMLIGHEYAGTINAVGEGVGHLSIGDAVTCIAAGRCDMCRNCLAGLPDSSCLFRKPTGGFTEQIVIPMTKVLPVPAGVDLGVATLAEPLTCCVRAMDVAHVQSGDTAVIIGAGPIGLMLLQVAIHSGIRKAIVSEINPRRREVAAQLGADITVDPTKESLSDAVQDATNGEGVDIAFEVAAVPALLEECIGLVKDRGRVVIVGAHSTTAQLTINLSSFHIRQLSLVTANGGPRTFKRAVAWLGQLELRPIITHHFDLADTGTAFDLAKSGVAIKALVGPNLG